jgi:hypothetical protein
MRFPDFARRGLDIRIILAPDADSRAGAIAAASDDQRRSRSGL